MMNSKNVDNNLKKFNKTLQLIKQYLYDDYTDKELKELSAELRERACSGESLSELLPESYALVNEVVKRTIKQTPFDVQIISAIAMSNGRIIELATGEGKTLVAVFVAFLYGLSGKGVHVLTFNDYLAKRDAHWMKPIYKFLGFTVSNISGEMNIKQRKLAYDCDVTYLTAKEAGFDYLRSFLVYSEDELVQREFNIAIIDEADSILIDEARIPLVIAGDMPATVDIDINVFNTISALDPQLHVDTDEYANNIALTETGVTFVENNLKIKNLYDEEHLDLLTKINVILQAVFLLKRDVDYIIKNDEVLLVDEFTGRVMQNRQWPDGIQTAVELKEGLTPKSHGVVMNRMTLQQFLQFYPQICGMTGTAAASANQFFEFYGKVVTVIPTHIDCIRIDHDDVVFTHKAAKYDAIINEIKDAHATGRPILIGMSNIEESEHLAKMLEPFIPNIPVLNAKNDEQEAEIIANAGRLNAVTISTNMAGRGVDIKLGGEDEAEGKKVKQLGGLYVIGTSRYESIRVDNQLRGRAGRQGDPGDSKFFISFEDNLLSKYRIVDILPEKYKSTQLSEPVENHEITKAVSHIQRVIEGQTLDGKMTLEKYYALSEDQRVIVTEKRRKILFEESSIGALEKSNYDLVESLLKKVTLGEYERARKQIELYAINVGFADHLLFIEHVMDGVQMIGKAGGDTFGIYNEKLIEGFEALEQHIFEIVTQVFDDIIIKDDKIDLDEMGIKGPSSTRTYMVHDGTEDQNLFGGLTNLIIPKNFFGKTLSKIIKK